MESQSTSNLCIDCDSIRSFWFFIMPFNDFLSPVSICIDTTARSKTAVFLKVSKLLCQINPQLDVETLFDAYWKRETLGSTAIGHGILIPHIRTNAINKISGCLLKLQHPVDFGADDKQPVDIVLGLVVASDQVNEHLQTLARIIKQFNNPQFIYNCRHAPDHTELCKLFIENSRSEIEMAAL